MFGSQILKSHAQIGGKALRSHDPITVSKKPRLIHGGRREPTALGIVIKDKLAKSGGGRQKMTGKLQWRHRRMIEDKTLTLSRTKGESERSQVIRNSRTLGNKISRVPGCKEQVISISQEGD